MLYLWGRCREINVLILTAHADHRLATRRLNKVVLYPTTSLARGATYKITIVGRASGVKDSWETRCP